jgi:ABC-type ATPase with predicted acetyltransferase domain
MSRLIELKPLFAYGAPTARSRRAKWIARTFDIDSPAQPGPSRDAALDARALASLAPAPGEIVLITGPSGAGKSSLLRAIRAHVKHAVRWIDLARIRPRENLAVIDQVRRISIVRMLEALSRVGLAEAWTYLRTPRELSDGQRWRLKLAMALLRAATATPKTTTSTTTQRRTRGPSSSALRPVIVCDEFAALLDRVTAAIVARTLRGAIARNGDQSALVATSHEDLARALAPDVIVRCDFGRVTIERARRRPGTPPGAGDRVGRPS